MDELFRQTEEWTITAHGRSGARSRHIETVCNEARHRMAFAQLSGTARYWRLNARHAQPAPPSLSGLSVRCATDRATSEPRAVSPTLAGRVALVSTYTRAGTAPCCRKRSRPGRQATHSDWKPAESTLINQPHRALRQRRGMYQHTQINKVPHKGCPAQLAREQAVRLRYSPLADHLYTILDNYIFVFLCNLQNRVSHRTTRTRSAQPSPCESVSANTKTVGLNGQRVMNPSTPNPALTFIRGILVERPAIQDRNGAPCRDRPCCEHISAKPAHDTSWRYRARRPRSAGT